MALPLLEYSRAAPGRTMGERPSCATGAEPCTAGQHLPEVTMSLTAGSASGGRWDREYCRLAEADPVLADLIDACGTSDPFSWHRDGPANGGRARESNFAALVLHIVGQQISVASAFAIYDRLSAALGGPPTPEAILRSTPERIRATGLSQRKIAYLLDVAGRQRSGALDLEDMHDLDDAAAVTALTAMKGVGQWTAEMFLIYQLHRARHPDPEPYGSKPTGTAGITSSCASLHTDPHSRPVPWRAPDVRSITQPIPLGVFEDARPAAVLLLRRNALVGGVVGSGKSGVLNVILAALTACEHVVVWGIGLKGGREPRPWAPSLGRLATTPGQAIAVLKEAVTELDRRATESSQAGARLLTRSIRTAARRDKAGRNVFALVDTPAGCVGRPSKSLTLRQAAKLIKAAQRQDTAWRLGAYVVLCLMSGIRTEEASSSAKKTDPG
jgi:endonuclease III